MPLVDSGFTEGWLLDSRPKRHDAKAVSDGNVTTGVTTGELKSAVSVLVKCMKRIHYSLYWMKIKERGMGWFFKSRYQLVIGRPISIATCAIKHGPVADNVKQFKKYMPPVSQRPSV